MTINERVKELRKALNLSGEKFGAKLGVKRSAISDIETGRNNLSEQMILSICLAYNVNEDWLRTGEGDMFNQPKDDFLTTLQKQYSLSDFQLNIVETYLELSEDDKLSVDKFIASCAKNTDN